MNSCYLFKGDHFRESSVGVGVLTLDRLVGNRELTKVLANHLGADVNSVEDLTVVDTDNIANHLGDDHAVTEVGLDRGGLGIGTSLGLDLAELSHEAEGLSIETTLELSTATGVEQGNKVLSAHVDEIGNINTTVRELLQSLAAALLSIVISHIEG